MDPIYKTVFGPHIDLAKIISISDVQLDTVSGVRVGFTIEFQLRDTPIKYSRGLKHEEDFRSGKKNPNPEIVWINSGPEPRDHFHAYVVQLADGTTELLDKNASNYFTVRSLPEGTRLLAEVNLQKEIDGLIAIWKAYRAWENEQKFGSAKK